MTRLNKQEFLAWAYDDLLTNTTRGVLAEYIVAKALGIRDTKRVEWDQYDLEIDGVKVEVKSAAYVQTWEQTRLSKIMFGIRPAKGWDARTNISATSAQRSADVYVFCLLEGEDREHIDPLDVEQWAVLCAVQERARPTSSGAEDDWTRTADCPRCAPLHIRELKAAIHEAAAVNRGS